ISPLHQSSCTLMSLDIKDLYYSLDSVLLLERVRELLEKNLVSFQAKAGISVDAVLKLLTCYLKATVLNFNGDCYIQRKGVCIGSAVAPVLTEFYLNTLDKKITDFVGSLGGEGFLVRRFVDDILVCAPNQLSATQIHDFIVTAAPELKFTSESAKDGKLQFLDLQLFNKRGLCWSYGRETVKKVLSRWSAHSKLVKGGVVRSLIGSALKKSCFHCVGNAFDAQIKRLLSVGYSLDFIVSSARRLLVSASVTAERVQGRTFAVIPYFHGFSHSLKALGAKFNVNVVFKTDFRLDKLTPFAFKREGCCRK
ncbi:unnamed protein product, partial [Ixodes pacificus]